MAHSCGGDLSRRLGNFGRNLTAQAQKLFAYWRSATAAAGAEPNTSGIQINKGVNQTISLGSYNITTFIPNQALKQTVGTAKSTAWKQIYLAGWGRPEADEATLRLHEMDASVTLGQSKPVLSQIPHGFGLFLLLLFCFFFSPTSPNCSNYSSKRSINSYFLLANHRRMFSRVVFSDAVAVGLYGCQQRLLHYCLTWHCPFGFRKRNLNLNDLQSSVSSGRLLHTPQDGRFFIYFIFYFLTLSNRTEILRHQTRKKKQKVDAAKKTKSKQTNKQKTKQRKPFWGWMNVSPGSGLNCGVLMVHTWLSEQKSK